MKECKCRCHDKIDHKKELQIRVLALDWKHHGWTGIPRDLEPSREEWKQAQEIIDLVRREIK